MAKIITVATHKGGVGKTTTAMALGAAFARAEAACLLIDLDPQGHCGIGLGVEAAEGEPIIGDALTERPRPIGEIVKETQVENLHIAPSNVRLKHVMPSLYGRPRREEILKRALSPVMELYDYIVIDTPPYFSVPVEMGIVAADFVVVPVEMGARAADAVTDIADLMSLLKRRLSQFASEAACNQKGARRLQQGLDDEPVPVVAQRQPSVLQYPSIAALDWPAPLAQARAMRPTAFVEARLGPKRAAQFAVGLGIVALVAEHGADPGHDREGTQEQALEQDRVVDVGRGGGAGHRHAVPVHRDMVLGAPLAPIRRVRAGEVAAAFGAHGACIEDQVGMAAQHADQQGVHLRQ
jgi:cellulose biosynthesis protein BcsQ